MGIFRTISDYEVWQPFNNGLTYRDVTVVYTNGDDIYAGLAKGLFKFDSPSQNWMSISKGIQNKSICSIAGNGNVLYVGTGPYEEKKGRFQDIPCFYKSTDQGNSWKASDKGIPDGTLVFSIAVNKKRPERIYLGTSEGIYRSTDEGTNWIKMKQGLPKNFRALDVKIARINNEVDVVYAAGTRGVFMTVDDDNTRWKSKNYDLPQTMITSIVIAPPGKSEN
jgi:hypothetical protein